MNNHRILSKIDQLETFLEKFSEIVPATEEEFNASLGKQLATERLLQICIEIMIDLVMIIIKEKHLGIPANEEDAFEKMRPFLKNIESYKEMKRFLAFTHTLEKHKEYLPKMHF